MCSPRAAGQARRSCRARCEQLRGKSDALRICLFGSNLAARRPHPRPRRANGGKVTHVRSDLWARCCSPYSAFRSCSPTRERAHHLEVYATCWQAVRTRFIRRRPALETCDSSPESGWLPALATPMAAPSAGSAARAALSITDPARMGSRELTHESPWLQPVLIFHFYHTSPSRHQGPCAKRWERSSSCALNHRSHSNGRPRAHARESLAGNPCWFSTFITRLQSLQPGMRNTECGLRAA